MNLINIDDYKKEIVNYCNKDFDWNILKNKKILISGSTGMIGKCLIDIIMFKNTLDDLNCTVYALGRNEEKAKDRFGYCFDFETFKFIECDINKPISVDADIDYILHAASSTHPLQYASNPIGTITANVMGTYNLLELGCEKNIDRFIFLSSVEVYGQNKGDVEKFDESYLGYIDCNTLRAGYPESKRTGEALCQAYIKQKDMDVVIARLSRIFGPTMLESDSKASSQFIKNSINEEEIVLKSEGLQNYSYLYVFDAVMGILTCLAKGLKGEAYNIADSKFDITLKEFASICSRNASKEVIFDLPSETEKAGFSTATLALMDSSKINNLGFKIDSNIEEKINDTIKILKKLK